MSISKQEKEYGSILRNGLIFIPVGGLILWGVMQLCWHLLPPEPISMVTMMQRAEQMQHGKKPSWWQQLISGMRAKAEGKRIVRRDPDSGGKLEVGHAQGVPSTVSSEEQLLMRQMLVAEEQLANIEGRPPASIAKRLSLRDNSKPWAPYELKRLTARMWSMDFERTRSHDVLKHYVEDSTAAATSKYASFEDYFYAGHANLCAGNIKVAREFLTNAEKHWPIKGGVILGLNGLFILMCDAIANRQTEFFLRLDQLQSNFPDLMYTEMYLNDIEYLEAAHPRAPLLRVLHGRILDLTYNDAKAKEKYLEARNLVGLSRRIVSQWVRELEERAK